MIMKHAMMRRASTFRKVIAARKREQGSVLFWIIILILFAAAGYPIYLWLTHSFSDPGGEIHRVDAPTTRIDIDDPWSSPPGPSVEYYWPPSSGSDNAEEQEPFNREK